MLVVFGGCRLYQDRSSAEPSSHQENGKCAHGGRTSVTPTIHPPPQEASQLGPADLPLPPISCSEDG
jgi:hypothetical protein